MPKEQSISPKTVDKHKQCPRCYGMHKGVGKVYHTSGVRRYYKCNNCQFTWSADIKTVVENVTVQHRDPGHIDQR